MPIKPDPKTNQQKCLLFGRPPNRFWADFGSILGPRGGSPEMLFGCPEGSWGYLGAKMVPKMVPRGPKKPPDDPKTDFDQILVDF